MPQSNVDQISDALNVSTRRVHQLVAAGMPRAARGRYDTDACLRWYVRFLQRAVEHRESLTEKSSTDAVRTQRARLLDARASSEEISLAEKRGELVPLAAVEEMMSGMILQSRQQLLQLPSRVAPELEGLDRIAIKQRLTAAVYAALTALAAHANDSPTPESHPGADPAPAGNGDGANGKVKASPSLWIWALFARHE